jgi:hypothetical protein
MILTTTLDGSKSRVVPIKKEVFITHTRTRVEGKEEEHNISFLQFESSSTGSRFSSIDKGTLRANNDKTR